MTAAGDDENLATVLLPSGTPVKVAIAGQSADGMASVGLTDTLKLDSALDSLSEITSLVADRLKAVKPDKATLEFHLGFSVESGRLISLLAGARSDASLSVTLEWAPDSPGKEHDG